MKIYRWEQINRLSVSYRFQMECWVLANTKEEAIELILKKAHSKLTNEFNWASAEMKNIKEELREELENSTPLIYESNSVIFNKIYY